MVTASTYQNEVMSRGLAETHQTAAVVVDGNKVTPICKLLATEGFNVDLLRSDDLLSNGRPHRSYDVVLLDLVHFDDRWQNACMRLRSQDHRVPIIVLSENSTVADRIRGFDSGCDEFLGKPYACNEISARLRALLRRSGDNAPQSALRYADLSIDLASRVAYRGNTRIELSRREFALLAFFIQNAEHILSREYILEHVWGTQGGKQQSNVVDVYVNYLRNKIEQGEHARLIQTVRGKGYVLHAETMS